MVHNVGRAPEHGAGQGIELKLMARPLAPRCVTTYGHLDAFAIVLLTRLAHQCVTWVPEWFEMCSMSAHLVHQNVLSSNRNDEQETTCISNSDRKK